MTKNSKIENNFIGKSPRDFNFTYTKLHQNDDDDIDIVDVIDNDQDTKYTLTVQNGKITACKLIPYKKKVSETQRQTVIEILNNIDQDEIKKLIKEDSGNTGIGAAVGAVGAVAAAVAAGAAAGAVLGAGFATKAGAKSLISEDLILGAVGGILGTILEEELNKK